MTNYATPLSFVEAQEIYKNHEKEDVRKAFTEIVIERAEIYNRLNSIVFIESQKVKLINLLEILKLELTSIINEIESLEGRLYDEEIYEWAKKILSTIDENDYYEFKDSKINILLRLIFKRIDLAKKYNLEKKEIEEKLGLEINQRPSDIIIHNTNITKTKTNMLYKKVEKQNYIQEIEKDLDFIDNEDKYTNDLEKYNEKGYFLDKLSKKLEL